jgi:fission process protein 1
MSEDAKQKDIMLTSQTSLELGMPEGLKQKDIMRDTAVRYLGYANEVGEAFKPVFPRVLVPSYVLAFGYVFSDTAHKVVQARAKGLPQGQVTRIGVDVLVWQTLASVIIPGQIIHTITAGAGKLFKSDVSVVKACPPLLRTWGPTIIGLSAIPLIIHPVDEAVDYLLDNTLRKFS